MVLTLILGALVLVAAVMIYGDWRMMKFQSEQIKRQWEHIAELEGDKRSLTESLCRAQGKPFIPPGPKEKIPSEGWFDAQPQIKVNTDRGPIRVG